MCGAPSAVRESKQVPEAASRDFMLVLRTACDWARARTHAAAVVRARGAPETWPHTVRTPRKIVIHMCRTIVGGSYPSRLCTQTHGAHPSGACSCTCGGRYGRAAAAGTLRHGAAGARPQRAASARTYSRQIWIAATSFMPHTHTVTEQIKKGESAPGTNSATLALSVPPLCLGWLPWGFIR